MYFGSGVFLRTNCHFRPGRESGAAAAAQPRRLDQLDDVVRLHAERLLQPVVALVLQVEVERVAVRLADVFGENRFHVQSAHLHFHRSSIRRSTVRRAYSVPQVTPLSAAALRAISSTSLPAVLRASPARASARCSPSPPARGRRRRGTRTRISVNMPEASVSPTLIPSFSDSASVTRSAPAARTTACGRPAARTCRPAPGRTSRSSSRRPRLRPASCRRNSATWRMPFAVRYPACSCTRYSAAEHRRPLPVRRILRQDVVERGAALRRERERLALRRASLRSDLWKRSSYAINGWKLIDPRLP